MCHKLSLNKKKKTLNLLSIEWEMSKPIHWCPFSVIVSPLSPDPHPKIKTNIPN